MCCGKVSATEYIHIVEQCYAVGIHISAVNDGYYHALSLKSFIVKGFSVEQINLCFAFSVVRSLAVGFRRDGFSKALSLPLRVESVGSLPHLFYFFYARHLSNGGKALLVAIIYQNGI